MNLNLQLPKLTEVNPRILVVGVGGAGGNAVNNMISAGLEGVQFVVANTDAQALAASDAEQRIQLGTALTEGLGAGSKPEIGEAAAEEAYDEIRSLVSTTHMVFIAAGMGGGTGSGAASVIARAAKEAGCLTVGVVTKPFLFEGARRMRVAEAGITALAPFVDTLIVIPNQNLFRIASDRTTFQEAFVLADQVLYSGIACIVDLILKEGLINLDFADVRTVMMGMGTAMMGMGEASGEHRATKAAEEAISNPLLDDISLSGAKGLLVSIIGGSDLTLYDVDEAASRVRQEVDAEANIIVGAAFDEDMTDRIRVSLVASGMARAGQVLPPPRDFRRDQAASGVDDEARAPRVEPAAFVPPPKLPDHVLAPPGSNESYQSEAPLHKPPPPPGYGIDGDLDAQSSGLDPHRSPEADELTRALSQAIEAAASEPQDAWRSAEGAVFEEAAIQKGGSPARDPHAAERDDDYAPRFEPAAPANVPSAARRMPDVDDFPAIGQKEYRAKMGIPEPPGESETRDRQLPERKPSFLSRITGSRRKSGATDKVHPQGARDEEYAQNRVHDREPRSGEHDQAVAEPRHGNDTDLPSFFGSKGRS